jgi:trans-2,3-dihydro-3-hydroxyanthranilate isomerase
MTRMRVLNYERCDVFTDQALAGNGLAVFTEADALPDATMQALAREMNLSESAFLLPAATSADARIRIFTSTMELPFAGHPVLGSAFVLATNLGRDLVRLETGRGTVEVQLTREQGRVVFGRMSQPLPRIAAFGPRDELLRALGVGDSGLPVEVYDNGPQYVYVELSSPEGVAALRPDMGRLAALGSYAFTTFARKGDRWKCRVFAPGEGIPEDPATGAAAGPLALHLARHGRVPFGEQVTIEQGVELGRPSLLHACAVGNAERVERIEVGGNAVIIGRGEIRLPRD